MRLLLFAVIVIVISGGDLMPRKGENIYKQKDGRWEGRYVKGRDGKKVIYGYVYSKSNICIIKITQNQLFSQLRVYSHIHILFTLPLPSEGRISVPLQSSHRKW